MELMASPHPSLQSCFSKVAGTGPAHGERPSNDAAVNQAAGLGTGPQSLVHLWAGTQLLHAASACLVRRIFGVGYDEFTAVPYRGRLGWSVKCVGSGRYGGVHLSTSRPSLWSS